MKLRSAEQLQRRERENMGQRTHRSLRGEFQYVKWRKWGKSDMFVTGEEKTGQQKARRMA